ncbi:MAG: hypothetical protein Q9228_004482, partial [Teloschistes exilis]
MPIFFLILWIALKVGRFFRSKRNHVDFEIWKKLGTDENNFLSVLNNLYYQSSTKRVTSMESTEMQIITEQRTAPVHG